MVLFWSGRRGSNSLPGIPRMAIAIRGSPASPRMISRAARRSRQPVLGAVCKKKKAPSSQMVLFWSGRRGSNSIPGIPRMAMAIRGSPASPRMISRAARRSRQRVLGAVCKKRKHHLLRWCFSGAGDEARTRYLDLGKVALYQMSYARKRKIDYNPAGGICQPLRSAFFSFFSG